MPPFYTLNLDSLEAGGPHGTVRELREKFGEMVEADQDAPTLVAVKIDDNGELSAQDIHDFLEENEDEDEG